jgi:hypothetical protein
VTFPARQYSINGERRSSAVLRPIVDAAATDGVRDADPRAYDAEETAERGCACMRDAAGRPASPFRRLQI